MVKEQVWNILSIEPTKDENVIKNAYRMKLANTNPEDDPEGFKRLREAYEMALDMINEQEGVLEKTPVDEWIDKAIDIYENVYRRRNPEEYKQLFEDEICVGLDTADMAREKFIVFLMDHFNLPQNIYQLINREFNIVESKNELREKFPLDFLDYVEYQVNHPTFINYDLFEITGLYEEDSKTDAYINSFYEVRRLFDEENYEKAKDEIRNSKEFNVYHPYMEVESMRIANMEKDYDKTFKICDKLMEKYGEDKYIQYICAAILYDNERYDEAMPIFEGLLEWDSEHYGAKLYKVQNEKRIKNFTKAKELVLEMLEKHSQDPKLVDLMREINEELLKSLMDKYEETGLVSDAIEYAWCVFQNENYEEAITFLETLNPGPEDEYEFTNLYGRCLFAAQKDEQAIPYLEKWKDMIMAAVDDGSEKYKKKMRRKGFAFGMLAMSYSNTKQYEKAVENFEKAIEVEESRENKLSFMERFSYCYIKMGQNEMAVDICDKIIEADRNYYPAYVNRQEAYFNLKRGQEVIDDYYNAIGLYKGYFKPYYHAAKVFFYFRQYEDSKGIIEASKQNECFNGALELLELRIARLEAEDKETREDVIKRLLDLRRRMYALKKEDAEIEDLSEIDYELCLTYYDAKNFEKALDAVETALRKKETDYGYHWTKADILSEMGKYQAADAEYYKVCEAWPDNGDVHYDRARNYLRNRQAAFAKEEFEIALKKNPDHHDAANQLMNLHQNRYERLCDPEDYNKALEYANIQLENNENGYYYVERGLLYMAGAEYEKSIEDYMKALEYYEDDMWAYNNAGYAYKVLGEYDKAIEMLKKSVEIMLAQGQKNVLPYSNLADCYEIVKDYDNAYNCYWQLMGMQLMNAGLYEDAAHLQVVRDDTEGALRMYRNAKELGGSSAARYHINVIKAYISAKNKLIFRLRKKMGDNVAKLAAQSGVKAISMKITMELTMLDKICKLSPDECDELADIYMYSFRNYKKALKYYSKALEETDKSSASCIDTLMNMARCNYFEGRADHAKQYARDAIEIVVKVYGSIDNYVNFGQSSPYRCGRIAKLYMFLGMMDEGRMYIDRMNKTVKCKFCKHKHCYDQYLDYGLSCEIEGNYIKALEYYWKAYEQNPYDTEIVANIEAVQKKM